MRNLNLPLHVFMVNCLDPDGPTETLGILDADNVILFRHDAWTGPSAATVQENCEFIVRAVNSHEALVSCVEHALACLEPKCDGQTIAECKAVLAKVTGAI